MTARERVQQALELAHTKYRLMDMDALIPVLEGWLLMEEALNYIAWPGPERDHWDRVNRAKEALASATAKLKAGGE